MGGVLEVNERRLDDQIHLMMIRLIYNKKNQDVREESVCLKREENTGDVV